MNEQELQQQIVALVQAAMSGDELATQQIQQIMQAAQQGDQQATLIAQMIQEVAQQMQQVQSAKFGAKLNYIKSLRGVCPEGTTAQYYKAGGRICKKCVGGLIKSKAVGGAVSDDPIETFKNGRKKKLQKGGEVPEDRLITSKGDTLQISKITPEQYRKLTIDEKIKVDEYDQATGKKLDDGAASARIPANKWKPAQKKNK